MTAEDTRDSHRRYPKSANGAGLELWQLIERLSTPGYLAIIALMIGFLLILSPDFGMSTDIQFCEARGRAAYDFYFRGFDSETFLNTISTQGRFYGPFFDVLITIAQRVTTDPAKQFELRTYLQALFNLSCLVPAFLISNRVLSKPLSLIAVILLVSTPLFFGHAFINPKDSPFASMVLWVLYLMLRCYENGKNPNYLSLVLLAFVMGLTISLRVVGAYLLLLVPIIALVLPVLSLSAAGNSHIVDMKHVMQQSKEKIPGLALLLVMVGVFYILLMPAVLASLTADSFATVYSQAKGFPWGARVVYFGQIIPSNELPWHYIYGFMLVQLPLYYHFFLITFAFIGIARWRNLNAIVRAGFEQNSEACNAIVVLILSVAIPLILVAITRPVLYNNIRHMTFIIPPVSLLVFFAFIWAIRQLTGVIRIIVLSVVIVLSVEPVVAMVRLHPYEYVYYNPLVRKPVPVRRFQLDYWYTSLRELAQELNAYADNAAPRKLRVKACVNRAFLTPFVDPKKIQFVRMTAKPDLVVGLKSSIGKCLEGRGFRNVITVGRQGSTFAAAVIIE